MKKHYQSILLLALAFAASAAPLPENIRDAVQQVRKSNGVQPRQPFYLLEQALPKAAGDVEQRQQLAKLLAEAVAAPDTTPAARTVLCQHLAKVAGESEAPLLRKLLTNPAAAADARIALGEVVDAPVKVEPAAVYLAQVAEARPATRVAGLSALAHGYPQEALPVCEKAMRDADPTVSATAIQQVGRLHGATLARELSALDTSRQALALDVLAEHKVVAACDIATRLTGSADETVKQSAIRALGAVGNASSVSVLAELGADEVLAQLRAPGVDEAIVNGIADGGGRAAESRVALINAAVARGMSSLTPVLLRAAGDADEKVQTAALKMIGRSGDVSAYPEVVALLGGVRSEEAESAARQMGRRMSDRQARLAPLLARLQGGQVPALTQVAVLRTLAPLGGEDALAPVRERLASPDLTVRDAAVRALAEWPDPAAVASLRSVADDSASSAVHRTLATRALERLASAWTRYSALAYLDCGPSMESVGKEGVRLRVVNGKPWVWTDQPEGTIAYSGDKLIVEVAGLKAGRAYQLSYTWWDYDGNGRVQSVWVSGQQGVAKTALPSWKGKQEAAATGTAKIPASAIKDGRVSVEFRREAASNAVVSEVWLADAPQGGEIKAVAPAIAALITPVVKANAGAPKKVLLVTGLEYPGHRWQETAPMVAASISEDKRLEVSVTEDPRTLAAPELSQYDVIVLNYQNHNAEVPAGSLANLKRIVEGGKGLVLVHFACGAFIDWPTKTVAPDFGLIAGRVWNPKMRGHDPRGPFRVRISDASHPVTKGLVDFDTEDELYTCLDGSSPIQVLASATSKVDQKEYPMAFVLTPGKGRTFHCVLGHDVKALNPAVGALYRRGTAWAAGLEP
jgi:type 1 glutamine amidotransferase/HEAT repeat protein